MSLSTWFREYVYIPLGGNRVTVPRHILNLLTVWALTGLWHGAHWNFVLWGLYYGIILIIEKYLIGKYIERAPRIFRHLYTMFIVLISWVLFSITDLSKMTSYMGIMFGIGKYPFADMTTLYLLRTNAVLLIAAGIGGTMLPANEFRHFKEKHELVSVALVFLIMLLSVAYLIYGSYNPFLYFRF